jgi:SEC-C motif
VKSHKFSERLTTLSPKAVMGRNELCWCKSGLKWKKCHYLRESQKPDPRSRLLHEFEKQKTLGVCLHGEAPVGCDNKIIRSHTVQRNGSLSAIAEDGHVYSGRDLSRSGISNGVERALALIGVANASTFKGFCSFHDNDTFRAADTATKASKEVAFQLAYRALAYEVFMKMIALPTMEAIRDRIDRGLEFERQAKTQIELSFAIQGFRAGLVEHQQHKLGYDRLLAGLWRTEFSGCIVKLDGVLPVVSSGTFFPEFDFDGNALQSMENDLGQLSLLSFNIVVIDGQTTAIFGWDIDPTGANSKFVSSLNKIPSNQLADVLIRFCFEISDNIFVRPSWWSSISQSVQSDLISRLRHNISGGHSPQGLVIGQTKYTFDQLLGSFETL